MSIIKKLVSTVKVHIKKAALLSEQLEPYMRAKEQSERAKRQAVRMQEQLRKAKRNQKILTAQLCNALKENSDLQQFADKHTVTKVDASCGTEPKVLKDAVVDCRQQTAEPSKPASSKRWSTQTMVDNNNVADPISHVIEQYTAQKIHPSIACQMTAYQSLSSASPDSVPLDTKDSFSSIMGRSHFIINAIDKKLARNKQAASGYNKIMASFYSKALSG
ncbi:hypothetical protein LPJ75_000998 [Coemansia sp. RSA 2598]|nr:hypothetical protein LPJ75_000998 [Coemansia sp. RSA 2598]